MTPDEIAETLSPGLRRAVLTGFGGGFYSGAKHGMWREWPDIIWMTGGRRSHRNTIVPLVKRGLAEKGNHSLYRLTETGLIVRDILAAQAGQRGDA